MSCNKKRRRLEELLALRVAWMQQFEDSSYIPKRTKEADYSNSNIRRINLVITRKAKTKKSTKQKLENKDNCIDISSDKLLKLHSRWPEYGKWGNTRRKKQNLFDGNTKEFHKNKLYQNKNWGIFQTFHSLKSKWRKLVRTEYRSRHNRVENVIHW